MKEFELGEMIYKAYCDRSGERTVFINLKRQIKDAWNYAAEELLEKQKKQINKEYFELLGFKIDEDGIVEFEKSCGHYDSNYSFRYSILDNFIIVKLEFCNKDYSYETDYNIFKLDYKLLFELNCKFNDTNNEELKKQLQFFIRHIEIEIKEQ